MTTQNIGAPRPTFKPAPTPEEPVNHWPSTSPDSVEFCSKNDEAPLLKKDWTVLIYDPSIGAGNEALLPKEPDDKPKDSLVDPFLDSKALKDFGDWVSKMSRYAPKRYIDMPIVLRDHSPRHYSLA